MFISFRKYKVNGSVEELVRRVECGFVPIAKKIPGFRSYRLIDCGDGIVATISVFESRDSVLSSNIRARTWVQENLTDFSPEILEIVGGEARITVDWPEGPEVGSATPVR